MRFESAHIRRFGCLEDVEIGTPERALPSIVAIHGPNESGKSTFFSFLTTLLYGFYPAKRTKNPYTPWLGEDPPEGSARIRLDAGEVQEIHRRLLSAPWGRLHTSGREEDVANKTLPCVAALDHVPKGVFEQVYALTLAELSGLEGKSWDLIQERLVGSMGADLKPAGKIVSEFRDEANKLWRPTKVGKPLYKKLQSELTALKERRFAAQKRDQDLRVRVTQLAEAEARSKALGDRRKRLRERRTGIEFRLNVLTPARKKLSRIDHLSVRAGPREELEGLPTDPRGHLKHLRDSKKQAKSQISDLCRQADRYREVSRRKRPSVSDLDHRKNVLLPVGKMLSRIEDLRDCAGSSEELDGLPLDPRAHLEQLDDHHRNAMSRVEELDGVVVDSQKGIADSQRKRQDVVIVEEKVTHAADRLENLRRKVNEADRAAEKWNERCRVHARNLLSAPWGQIDRSQVSAVSVVELEKRLRKYQSISKQRVDGEGNGPGDGARRPGWGRLFPAGIAFVLVLVTWSSVRALGVAAVILAISLLWRWWVQVGNADRVRAQWAEGIATLKSQEESARDELGKLIGGLPIQAWLLEPSSLNLLLERVRRMVDLSNDLTKSKRVVARRRERLDDETSVLTERAAHEIGRLRETTTAQVHGDLRTQSNALREATHAIQEKIKVAKMDLARTEAEQRKAKDELGEIANELGAFTRKLASFGAGNVDRGLTEVVKRLEAGHRASQLEDELQRNHPNLDELVAQIEKAEDDGETWNTLKERLKRAQEARDRAKTAQGKLETIESQEEEAKEKLRKSTKELLALEKRLARSGGGSVDLGLNEVVERLRARGLASQLRTEFELEQRNLDDVVAQIHKANSDGETWDSLPEDLKAMDESLQGLIDEEGKQGKLIGRLQSEIQSIQREEAANQVQEEIELVEAQMLDAQESRDRLFLLAKLVQEADRRFRERHQPALLKQAGRYVDQITGGRYDRIVIGETGEKFFSLRDPANAQLRKMSDPFSQGIKEQVYFALRLAAIDHLDADKERLPLFLDEVFVNWDLPRLDRAFKLVEQVARQRQVFFFTCHEAMAAKLEDAGGMIIDLS